MDNVIKLVRGPSPKNIVVIPVHREGVFKFVLADISTRSVRAEIWTRKLSNDKKAKAEYYGRIGQRVQDMIHSSSREVVKSLFEGDPDKLAHRMVRYAEEEYKLEIKRRKANILYEKDGWAIYNPVPSVWMVTSPYGFLTATVSTEDYIQIRMNAGAGTDRIHANLRNALALAIQDLFKAGKRPYRVAAIAEMLNEAGITPQVGGVLSDEAHARLRDIMADLTQAAREQGMRGIDFKLKELAVDAGVVR